MFLKAGLITLAQYLDRVAKTSPNSALIYADHFKSFLSFLSDREYLDEKVSACALKQLKSWRRKLRGRSKNFRRARPTLEVAKLQQMLSGTTCTQARQLIAASQDLSATQLVTVRDYIWLTVLATNACRPAELTNMTLLEFNEAQQIDDCFIVAVSEHKTGRSRGASQLVLTTDIYKAMQFYQSQRPEAANDITQFFLTRSYGRTNTTLVAHALNREYGTGREVRVRVGTIRRHVTTHVHRFHGYEDKDLLARKLNHSMPTAEAHYKDFTRGRDALRGSKLVIEALQVADLL